MTTAFPTAIDLFNNPAATDTLGTTGVLHDLQHDNINDAIHAAEVKIGINGSADTASLDFKQANHKHTGLDGSASLIKVDISPLAAAQSLILRNGSAVTYIIGSSIASEAALLIDLDANRRALVIQGAAAQAVNLQEWQTSTGTVLASVGPGGALTVPSLSSAGAATVGGLLTASAGLTLSSGTLSLPSGSFGTPSSVGTANAPGSSGLLPRLDHVHKTFYMVATTKAAIASPAAGDTAYETSNKRVWGYSGSAWELMYGRCGTVVRRVATQNTTSGTPLAISFDTEDEDTDAFFPATGTTVTVPTGLPGRYSAALTCVLSAPPGSRGYLEIVMGGRTFRTPWALNEDTCSAFAQKVLAVGDTVTANVYQLSGGTLTITATLDVARISN